MANSLKKIAGYVPLPVPDVHQYLQEINRGKGSPQSKKGKGSYKRNNKYKGGDY